LLKKIFIVVIMIFPTKMKRYKHIYIANKVAYYSKNEKYISK